MDPSSSREKSLEMKSGRRQINAPPQLVKELYESLIQEDDELSKDKDDNILIASSGGAIGMSPKVPNGRTYRSPTLNINICFPQSSFENGVADDSSADSSNSDNYFRNLRRVRRPNHQKNQDLESVPRFGSHKKRIITPPHKLRNNLLRTKKLRLEKEKSNKSPPLNCNSHQEYMTNKSNDPLKYKKAVKPRDDDVLQTFSPDVRRVLLKTGKNEEKKKDKCYKNETIRDRLKPKVKSEACLSDSDSDVECLTLCGAKKLSSNGGKGYPEGDVVASTSSDVNWRNISGTSRMNEASKDKLKPNFLSELFSSDDEEPEAKAIVDNLNLKSIPNDNNEYSSDSDNELSWIGPSPRSNPSRTLNVNLKVPANSKPTLRICKNPPALTRKENISTADDEESRIVTSPLQRLCKKKSKEAISASNRHSSDADGSSNANSSTEYAESPLVLPTNRRSTLSCRPKVYNVTSSSDSEESPAPPNNHVEISPDSPGVADALQKIQQIEADEAYARRLQFEINKDLYGGAPSQQQPRQTTVSAEVNYPQSASTSWIPSSTVFSTRNPYTRSMSGRTTSHVPTTSARSPPSRSPQTRTSRGRSRRYPQPLLDSHLFNEPFVELDSRLRSLISGLESDEDNDPDLVLNHLTQSGNPSDNELDDLLHAIMTQRTSPRLRSGLQVLRRRSPRGHRQRRSFALVPVVLNDLTDYEELLAVEDRIGHVPVGLSRAQIHRLPTKQYIVANNDAYGKNRNKSEDEDNCHICLCDYDDGENLRILPCFHEFHTLCIDRWLQVKDTCPVCRMQVQVD